MDISSYSSDTENESFEILSNSSESDFELQHLEQHHMEENEENEQECESYELVENAENDQTLEVDILKAQVQKLKERIEVLEVENEELKHKAMINTQEKHIICPEVQIFPLFLTNTIQELLNGEWRLIDSTNIDNYLQHLEINHELEVFRWKFGNQFFEFPREVDPESYKNCTILQNQSLIELTVYLDSPRFLLSRRRNQYYWIETRIEENRLVTRKTTREGAEFGRIERFVENGFLIIVNLRDTVRCERVYERVR